MAVEAATDRLPLIEIVDDIAGTMALDCTNASNAESPVPENSKVAESNLAPVIPPTRAEVIKRSIKVLEKQARKQRQREFEHTRGMGKQVSSTRESATLSTFERSETGRIPKPQPVVILKHDNNSYLGRLAAMSGPPDSVPPWQSFISPPTPKPLPCKYRTSKAKPEFNEAPVTVLTGWGHERRFLTDVPKAVLHMYGNGAVTPIIYSTRAHPFSGTFPYESPKKSEDISSSPEDDNDDMPPNDAAVHAGDDVNTKVVQNPFYRETGHLGPVQEESVREAQARSLRPQTMPDLNETSVCKIVPKPAYSVPKSCIGTRFKQGTKFSRRPVVRLTGRLVGFRELRDQLPPGMPPKVVHAPPGLAPPEAITTKER